MATAELSYAPLLETARASGAELIGIPLDARGLDVDALARHPRLSEVRAVYVTPHHQYPTTVSLAPERRLALLELARERGFAILEDDYDYDFHYERLPRLPLAALDAAGGQVVYVGSFTKMLAPNLRVGFMHGPPDFLDAVLRLRLLADRQGDLVLERALAHFVRDGSLERHLNRVRPVYHARRDRLVELLRARFGEAIEFDVPTGGMAVWIRFRETVDFEGLRGRCAERGITLADSPASWCERGGMRLGFASLDEGELERAVGVLREVL